MHIRILHINPLIPQREIQCRFTCKSYKNNISIHSSREGRYDSISNFVLKNQYISIHSSHKGRYFKFIKGGIYPKHFNSLIPQREIQQYCTKMHCYIFTILQKLIYFLHLLPQKLSKF